MPVQGNKAVVTIHVLEDDSGFNGGDVKRRDKGGDTPLDVAEMMGKTKLLPKA